MYILPFGQQMGNGHWGSYAGSPENICRRSSSQFSRDNVPAMITPLIGRDGAAEAGKTTAIIGEIIDARHGTLVRAHGGP